ncbi:ornithine cyclodeaminase [Geomicrobium halophilum]|uniref:Ornithine cyclodeaminase n=1 Tax=Geomicrobium halophilum TaxID=549000 RepID=A0A841PR35_9BACL|nr:cyclodeaminase [Geomicrobium halophilum]MBB6449636.1 ornithine cyclodeaminase [Geomicrobium halophilum]
MDIFKEEEIRQNVNISSEAFTHIEDAFRKLYSGGVSQPPVIHVNVPEHNGEADIKTAYIPGFETFAIKVSAGFFDNPKKGLPSLGGLMLAMDSETGVPRALLQDNGYLTDVRTALAGAVAADQLALKEISSVGVIGTGMQARLQVEALKLVRSFHEVHVWGRTAENVKKYQKEMEENHDLSVRLAESAEEVVRGNDLVVTTTPSTEPLIQSDWLHAGLHITAMGSDAEKKQELSPDVFPKADLVVGDLASQVFSIGELQHAKNTVKEDDITELGKILSGDAPGRTHDEQITIADLTGTGIQDTAIANYALERMKR